jgi:hypothetical protein
MPWSLSEFLGGAVANRGDTPERRARPHHCESLGDKLAHAL